VQFPVFGQIFVGLLTGNGKLVFYIFIADAPFPKGQHLEKSKSLYRQLTIAHLPLHGHLAVVT